MLIALSILGLVKKRNLFLLSVIGISVVFMVSALTNAPINANAHVPGRMLILSFLAAVSLFLYREKVPCNKLLGWLSVITTAIFLEIPSLTYLAAFPLAYMTVWLGVMRPRTIPFGDLSYGLFLFHFPVEQLVMHIAPAIRHWYMLTLISLPLALGCAWVSWTLVEHPILRRKKIILAETDKWWLNINQSFLFRKMRGHSKISPH
jgi:peptidoglycan/LPS O-acetylase OafA/YrhL